MSTNGYPEDILTANDAINHNLRLLQPLLPPWPERFNTFREAKKWVLVQCVTGGIKFAKFPEKSNYEMRGNVIYRATRHAQDARLFSLPKTEEVAITDPAVNRTNRSNTQKSVIPRGGKGTGNKIRDCYEEPRERPHQGNNIHELVRQKALNAQRHLGFPGEDIWPPKFDSEEAAHAWTEEKLNLMNFIYGKCPRGGRGNKWWREEIRRRTILNARNAGFCTVAPPASDETSADTAEDSEESDSSGGVPIFFHTPETIADDETESNAAQSSNWDDARDGHPPTTRYDSIHNDDNLPSLLQTIDPETLPNNISASSQKSFSDWKTSIPIRTRPGSGISE